MSVDATIFDQANIAKIEHIIHKPTVPPDAGLTDYWELDGMYVVPKFQRKSLGKQLLQWGIEQARIENIPIVIKSSPVGLYFYEHSGFQLYKKEEFEPFFEVGARGMHLMIWEPSTSSYWLKMLKYKS
jgi:GNAT superfamily N-acetyltransferase